MPCRVDPCAPQVELGHPVVDDYLELVRVRCRPNTLLATAYDLKVFFTVVGKDPLEVTTADVLGFVKRQRSPRSTNVVRLADGGSGVALSTIKRRLSSVSGFTAIWSPAARSRRIPCCAAWRHGRQRGDSGGERRWCVRCGCCPECSNPKMSTR
jgi:hypothetical protein